MVHPRQLPRLRGALHLFVLLLHLDQWRALRRQETVLLSLLPIAIFPAVCRPWLLENHSLNQ